MNSYDLTPVAKQCPVCHSRTARLLYSVNHDQAAQHFVLGQADPQRFRALKAHIRSLWGGPRVNVIRCENCRFCFADPFVAGDALFYTLAYDRSGYPTWKWEFQITLETLVDLMRRGELSDFHLLEVGAGDGAFVKRVATDLTPNPHILCTEFSDYGRNAIEQLGITCLPEDVRNLDPASFAVLFDVICLFQVLEHMDDLDALFQQLGLLAKRKAHLFVAVPNPNRISFNETHGGLLDMPPNHVGRWNPLCFQVLAQRHGWRVVRHAIQPESYASKVKQFVMYRYLRKRQDSTTLANHIERILSRPVRRAFQVAAVPWYSLGAVSAVFGLRADSLGDSLWIHLEKL